MIDEKDNSIQELVAELDLAARDWILVDYWEGDRCAIGVAARSQPRRLVYISSFGRASRRFAYQCEMPSGPEEADAQTLEAAQDASVQELIAAMERHFVR